LKPISYKESNEHKKVAGHIAQVVSHPPLECF